MLTRKNKSAAGNGKHLFRVTTFQAIPHPDPGGPAGLATHSTIFNNKTDAFAYAARQTIPFLILSPDAPPIGHLPEDYHLDLARELAKATWTSTETSPFPYVRGLVEFYGKGQISEAFTILGYKAPPPDSGIAAQGSGQVEPAYVPPKRKRPGIEDEPALPSVTSRRTRRDKGQRRKIQGGSHEK